MEERKRGRPKKAEEDRASITFTLRLTPPLFEELRAEAEANGRTMTAQIERRLGYRETDVTRVVAAAVAATRADLLDAKASPKRIRTACHRAARIAVDLAYGMAEGMADDVFELAMKGASQEQIDDLNASNSRAQDAWAVASGTGIPD